MPVVAPVGVMPPVCCTVWPNRPMRRHLGLAIVNDAPVVLAGHRIEITLAQETLIVGLHQLVNGVGIAAVFVVIDLDRPGILLAAMYGFFFLIAADGIRHLGRRDRQRDHNQQDHEQNAEQQKALFLLETCIAANWILRSLAKW